uniref:ATPase F0 subunit 8 n=1 Tax=Clymenella torquata TaxID=292503 RepID=Q642X2_CLYTO|nr:ATP synthase F0 subunit 8 [Clymenella torquata]AAU20736.1 ATPase F0 subunit 8 [Clymenella torquata]
MPHLSPLSWMLAPLMFFFILSMLHSSMWWQTQPSFKKVKTQSLKSLFKIWNW